MTLLSENNTVSHSRGLPILTGLALWFALILWLAARGTFVTPAGGLPVLILTAAAVPPLLFLAGWTVSGAVRAWVAALDLTLVTAVQAWRVIGAAFIVVWAMGDLPLAFAAPAGLGDVAVGVFAIWVTVAVARRSAGWRAVSYGLIAAGLLDFVAAISTAILSDAGRMLDFANAPQPELLQVLPLAMIPAFAVPFFIIAHLIAWLKLRSEA